VLILSVCPVPLPRGKTKRPMNTKLGRKSPWDTSTLWNNFKVKGSTVKVTAAIIHRSHPYGFWLVSQKLIVSYLYSPDGATISLWQLNCKDGPIAGGPSTAAPSCYYYYDFIKINC